MSGPEQFFAALLAAEPAQPFVTYYDEASGERTELSTRSLANWVAKTHFLLTDELGLGPGDHALVALPAHWISVPAVLGCMTAGLSVTSDSAYATVAFVSPATALEAALVPDVFAINPAAPAVGFADGSPAGANDYVAAVRPQADAWGGVRFRAKDADPCLEGLTRAEVADTATARAEVLGWQRGARVLTTRAWNSPADLLDTLFAPLAVGGSVVYVAHCTDEATIQRRMEQEHATVRL